MYNSASGTLQKYINDEVLYILKLLRSRKLSVFERRHPDNRLNGCWEDGSVGEMVLSRSAPSIVLRNPAIKMPFQNSFQNSSIFTLDYIQRLDSSWLKRMWQPPFSRSSFDIFSPSSPSSHRMHSFPVSDHIPSLFSPKLHHAATSIFLHHVLQNPELSWPLGGSIWRFRSDVCRWETINQGNKNWDH